jgi:DNA-binding IclR family transcriptional regulator
VLEALTKAQGEPLTAGQVASSTGLGRPSVSTTLSKLARSGDVIKAERGYAIAVGGQKSGG